MSTPGSGSQSRANGPWSTETPNPRTGRIDRVPLLEAVRLLHAEDHLAVEAVDRVLPDVARAAGLAAETYRRGGRWVFVGAGTSGRIAFAEAAELPPTFGLPPDRALARMAGGYGALEKAVEGAEDDSEAGENDLRAIPLREGDFVVGLAASGRTPYVVGALRFAREVGARTVAVSSVPGSPITKDVDVAICPDTGPEAILGSTRLKAGTAQKLVMNMITTAAMIEVGRVYRNLMVHMEATNEKLRERAERLVSLGAGVDDEGARAAVAEARGQVATAIASILLGVSAEEAAQRLAEVDGDLRRLPGA